MGFSLTPAQLAEVAGANAASAAAANATTNEDDIEKLKALEALKLDNVSLLYLEGKHYVVFFMEPYVI